MSQRKFSTPAGTLVMAGWDRPLQHFFLNIDDVQGRPIFDNLWRKNAAMTLTQISEVLKLNHITPPAKFFDDLEDDQRRNAGNEIHWYREG